MENRRCIIMACLLGGSGVVLGALGAHGLEDQLAEFGTTAVWETAVDYQMWHAIVILVLGLATGSLNVRFSCIAFTVGILLFSGSLYWLALGGPRWLGPMTPLGGLSLISGWAGLLTTVWQNRQTKA